MSKQTPDTIAFHEAGHFIASYRLLPDRLRNWLSIEPNGRYAGESNEEAPSESEEPEDMILVYYAGYAAEVVYAPKRVDDGRAGAADDDEKANELLADIYSGSIERQRAEQRLRARAQALVVENWEALRAVANEVLARTKLGAEVAEMIVGFIDGSIQSEPLAKYLARVFGSDGAVETLHRLGLKARSHE